MKWLEVGTSVVMLVWAVLVVRVFVKAIFFDD